MNFINRRSLAAWHICFILSVSNVWDTGTLQPAFELQPGGDRPEITITTPISG